MTKKEYKMICTILDNCTVKMDKKLGALASISLAKDQIGLLVDEASPLKHPKPEVITR